MTRSVRISGVKIGQRMTALKSKVERLEKGQRFRRWFRFGRFLESLTDEQLEDIAIHWRFPDRFPDPLPMGMSRLDGIDRNGLIRLYEESERETARLMREIKGRSEDEHRFYLHHGHWPEQPCSGSDCLETSLPTERIKP